MTFTLRNGLIVGNRHFYDSADLGDVTCKQVSQEQES